MDCEQNKRNKKKFCLYKVLKTKTCAKNGKKDKTSNHTLSLPGV